VAVVEVLDLPPFEVKLRHLKVNAGIVLVYYAI
jgi:hypothetical protein